MFNTDKQTPVQFILSVALTVTMAIWFFIWLVSGFEKHFDETLYNPQCSYVYQTLKDTEEFLKRSNGD